jgi:transcriptional regulator of aromatic amino acid metabolism
VLLSENSQRAADSLIAETRQISALVVLEQCPIPVIAVADDGAVVFANTACEHLLGNSCDAVTAVTYDNICSALPVDETLFAVTPLGPNAIASLMLLGQATVFVKMRKSAIRCGADLDRVAIFEELVARLSR